MQFKLDCINIGLKLDNWDFNYLQIQELYYAINKGLNLEQLKIFADPIFNDRQMWQLTFCFLSKIELDIIKQIANPKFSNTQMIAMKIHYLNNGCLSLN